MRAGLLAALVLIGCTRAPALDGAGRLLLDPVRAEALRPEQLIARLALRPDATLADVGAGPGFLTLPLAAAVPRGRVVATDVRADYLAVAAARARAAGLGNVETRVTLPEQAGLDAASVDVALLCQVDQYLPDRARYFASLATALRPGGRLVLLNQERFRQADLDAARAARFEVTDRWSPSPPVFALVLTAHREEP